MHVLCCGLHGVRQCGCNFFLGFVGCRSEVPLSFRDDQNPNWSTLSPFEMMLLEVEKVHGSLACAGKVRGQTPKVAKQDKKKKPRGRAFKRMQYTSASSRPDSFDPDAINEPSIDQDIEMGTQVTRCASDLGMDSFSKQMDHVVAKKKVVLEATLTELDLLCTHHEIEPRDAQTKLLFCILFEEEP